MNEEATKIERENIYNKSFVVFLNRLWVQTSDQNILNVPIHPDVGKIRFSIIFARLKIGREKSEKKKSFNDFHRETKQ